mmetsp:Transcript_2765/g.6076  ORF Transcript_2765/g.6076 Transcript_2765/m.6076 type:complete len:500 (+) Transcript_2765:127-1626(+)
MNTLWKSGGPTDWHKALHSVDEAVRCTGKDRLQLLEEWFRTKLPKDLGARDPQPYLTREELVKLVDWKLTHGKWRPKLLEYAKDQDEKDVKEISEKALKALQGCVPGQRDKVQSALQTLTALKGVGPATASAVLAAACPHVPFMSDEALEAAVGKRDYTVKVYMSLVEALQNKAQQLNEQQQQQEEEVWGSKKAVQAVRQLRSMGAQVFPPGNKEVMDWGVLAGYEDQKRQIEDCLLYPLLRPEVYNRLAEHTRHSFQSNRPRAVLFEGPPGTGKTTSARVISSQASVPLVYVPLESVMSKWFGESEGLLARVFSAANDLGGAIIFIDELDSLGGSRERGDMHEASRRMLSVLLREMDGFDASRRAIVIGATNRKSDLDAALLSRFDLVINFGLPDTNCRRLILARYARHLSPADLEALAGRTAGLAGRDLRDVAEHTERRWASKIIRGEVAESSLPPLGEYVRSAESRLAALQMEGLPGALPLGLPGVIEGMQPSTSL